MFNYQCCMNVKYFLWILCQYPRFISMSHFPFFHCVMIYFLISLHYCAWFGVICRFTSFNLSLACGGKKDHNAQENLKMFILYYLMFRQ